MNSLPQIVNNVMRYNVNEKTVSSVSV